MNRLWRLAGGLLLAHVILLLAGYSQMRVPVFDADPADIVKTYADVATNRMYAGGYVGILAWLVLLAAVTLLARLLRPGAGGSSSSVGADGRSESSGAWLAGLVATAGTTATAVTATAFVATGAAFSAAKHGYPADLVAGLTTASKFADFVAMSALGLCTVAIGAAALVSRALPRWLAFVSVLIGIVGIASGAHQGLLDIGNLLWLAYVVVLSVVLLRGPVRRGVATTTTTERTLVASAQ
jgi:hypothetical protein